MNMKTATAAHTAEVRAVHEKFLSRSSAKNRFIKPPTGRVHVIEAGDGPPVVLFNGSGPSALHMLPLLERIDGARTIAVDRPGFGLSDPADVPKNEFRQAAVVFVDGVMDALGVDGAVVGGSSMGATIATWYALARPERVRKLLLIGAPPLFPGTSAPGMLRLVASPIGTLLGKLMKPSPKLVVRNMKAFGEGETITRYPELIAAQVVAAGDKTYANTSTGELKTIISIWGFRSEFLLSDSDLAKIKAPTQIIWGNQRSTRWHRCGQVGRRGDLRFPAGGPRCGTWPLARPPRKSGEDHLRVREVARGALTSARRIYVEERAVASVCWC
jgi:pimeloyl-ACP methyl ester carboxylesterase